MPATPSIKAIGSYTSGASLSVSPPWPTHDAGDLGILIVCGARNNGNTALSGWTLIGSGRAFSGTNSPDNGITCFYRIATSSSEAAPTWTHTSGVLGGRIVTFKDFDTSTPIEAEAIQSGAGSGASTMSISGITTTVNNALAVIAFVDSYATAANNVLSVTNGFSIDASGYESGSNGFSQYLATKVQATAGAVGATVFDFDVYSTGAAIKFAIRGAPITALDGSGSGSFSVSGSAGIVGAINGSGSGSVAISSAPATIGGIGRMIGSSGFALSGQSGVSATGTASGTGSIAIAGDPLFLIGSYPTSGSGSFAVSSSATIAGVGAMSGIGGISFTGIATAQDASSSAGFGSFQITGTATAVGVGPMQGAGTISLGSSATLIGRISGSGSGSFALTSSATLAGIGALSGAGSITMGGTATGALGSIPMSGSGTISITGSAVLDFEVPYGYVYRGGNIGLWSGWAEGQSGWGDAMNENLRELESLVQANVVSSTVTTPPASPEIGQMWAVPFNALGAWLPWRGYFARYGLYGWEYIPAKSGWVAWDHSVGNLIVRQSLTWEVVGALTINNINGSLQQILQRLLSLESVDISILSQITNLLSQINQEAEDRGNADAATAMLIDQIHLRIADAEGELAAEALAREQLEARVSVSEDGIESMSSQWTLLSNRIDNAAIGGRGVNVLSAIIASFEEAYLPPYLLSGGASIELDPIAKHGSQGARLSFTNTGGTVKLGPFAIAPNRDWIVSGEIMIPLLQGDDPSPVSIGLQVGAETDTTPNLIPSSGTFTRASAIADMADNAGQQAYVVISYGGASEPCDVYVDCLMVEERIGDLTTPSAWVMPPMPIAESSAYQGLLSRVESTEVMNDAHAAHLIALDSAVQGVESANTANSEALSLLESRTTATEGEIVAQASQITSLQASVSTLPTVYVQDDEPTGGTYNVGDVWFDSNDGNTQYIWDGSAWNPTASVSGATIYRQSTAPTGGSYNVGDIWLDSDDGNRIHRWDGSSWIDVSDARIAAQGTAISGLNTRVTAAEGALASTSTQITELNNSIGTRPRTYVQDTDPGTTGRINGDLWINPSDGNKSRFWDSGTSQWVVRSLGARTTIATTAPANPSAGDLWFDSDDNYRMYRFNGVGWSEVTSTIYASAIATLNSQVSQKTTTIVSPTQPSSSGRVVGDVWIDTGNGNLTKVWLGSSWSPYPYSDPNKNKTSVGTVAPSSPTIGDIWIDTTLVSGQPANILKRWNGASWIEMTDRRTSANASAITALTAVVEGKADVSAVESLEARVETIESEFNVNLLRNPALAIDGAGWGILAWNEAEDAGWQCAREGLGEGYRPSGKHNLTMWHEGTPVANKNIVYTGDYVECDPANEYIFSAYLAANNLSVFQLRAYFYDAELTYLSEAASPDLSAGHPGGPGAADYERLHVLTTPPPAAKWMRLGMRGYTSGATAPRAHMYDMMIERAIPGQTLPSPFNLGPSAAWAKWNVSFNVNGHISGISLASDGRSSKFAVAADAFEVAAPGGGPALTWTNGTLWNKGADHSVIIGQDLTPDGDVIFWIGPNPASPQAATKADAAMYITEEGSAVYRGLIQQSLLSGSAMELGSTRIHTGGGRLAPFAVREFSYKGQANGAANFSATVTLPAFQSPNIGSGYHHLRLSRQKCDVVIDCTMHGDGSGGENVYIEVQYNGGAWTTITSRTGINVDYRGAWTFLIRYTTLETWDTVAFRARTNNGNTICLALSVLVDNTYESGNAPGSVSGLDATTGGGGAAPPAGGGGGGGGFECVDYDSVLPDGRLVRELQVGDLVECVDMATLERGMFPLLAMGFGEEDCYRVLTNSGEVIQSASTPMDMRDGSVVRTPDLAGLDLLHYSGRFEVASIEFVGPRRVCKPDLGNRMFFAGVRADSAIATHNILNKELEP